MIRAAHFALFYLLLFFPFHLHLSVSHSEPLSLLLHCPYFSHPVSSCLPALSLSWLAPILLSVFSLPLSFLLLSKLRNARQTTSPISTPDVFIFLPAFHALLDSSERPTPLISTASSSSQFCLFPFFVPRSGERTGPDEKETYSLVYPCLHEINTAPAIPPGCQRTIKQVQV